MLHWIGYFLSPSMHDKLSWSEEITMADTNNTHLTRPILVQKPFYPLPIGAISSSSHTWHPPQDLHYITFKAAVVPKFMLFGRILRLSISRPRWNSLGHCFLGSHGIVFLLGWCLDIRSNSFGWMCGTYIWNVVWDTSECIFGIESTQERFRFRFR